MLPPDKKRDILSTYHADGDKANYLKSGETLKKMLDLEAKEK